MHNVELGLVVEFLIVQRVGFPRGCVQWPISAGEIPNRDGE